MFYWGQVRFYLDQISQISIDWSPKAGKDKNVWLLADFCVWILFPVSTGIFVYICFYICKYEACFELLLM